VEKYIAIIASTKTTTSTAAVKTKHKIYFF